MMENVRNIPLDASYYHTYECTSRKRPRPVRNNRVVSHASTGFWRVRVCVGVGWGEGATEGVPAFAENCVFLAGGPRQCIGTRERGEGGC